MLTYNGPHADGDRIWVIRDRRLGACPTTPADARQPDVRWLLGRPATGLPARTLFTMDRTRAIRRGERGHIRVCAWLRREGAPGADGHPTEVWSRARRYFILRRVVPTQRELRLGVRQIRAEMYRSSRVWHRLGYRTRTVGPKFSRIDPTFAAVGVTGATRTDQMYVQAGHTIYHLSAGRWHRLQGIAGDIEGMWCDEDGGSAGQVPLMVLRGFFGPRICRGW
ncbi:MAG TPA: hypothetical protein PKE32_03665 [Miltoncostaeaceae bacterium]|nr:hypothetical protein [Miltoncostaeaceae bacterium]